MHTWTINLVDSSLAPRGKILQQIAYKKIPFAVRAGGQMIRRDKHIQRVDEKEFLVSLEYNKCSIYSLRF